MAAAGEEAETEVIPSDAGWDAAASDPWVFGSCCIGAAFEGPISIRPEEGSICIGAPEFISMAAWSCIGCASPVRAGSSMPNTIARWAMMR